MLRWASVGALCLAGCAEAPGPTPVELRAELGPNGSVELAWSSDEAASGYWVELATPGTDFTKLALAWRGDTHFVHERVAADTTFLYRVRPFVGEPSSVVVAEAGTSPSDPALEEGPLHEPSPARVSTLSVARVAEDAAELRWPDDAAEDGYMLELASAAHDFQLGALLPPDSTSFRKLGLPSSPVRFRVRAFSYRAPSQVARLHTPTEPQAR